MKMMMPRLYRALSLLAFGTTLAASSAMHAQVARRLSVVPSSSTARVALDGSMSKRLATSATLGHLQGNVQLHGMSLTLAPTVAQDAALTQLLANQQNPASPSYHQWLTPAQFGASFGVADADIAILESWLQGNGFTVEYVAPSRNRIVFSGTSAAVETAFGTTLQRYTRGTQTFFENSTNLQIPAAFSGLVSGVGGLSSYRIQPPVHNSVAKPLYTTASGKDYMVPWDVRQIFGSNTLVSQGFDGTGIKIGVLGQSAVSTTQLTYFQGKTGQTVKLPTMVQVPGTGTSGTSSGDEGESELDLEYASGSAPGATVLFIYTGLGDNVNGTDGNNNGVFDSLAYAITDNLAPILTLSYGLCETEDVSFITGTMEPYLKQANAQGQTFFASSGDDGAASCETASAPTIATGGLSVSYPASSTYATGVGGTQLTSSSASYWSTTNNSYAGSAIGYIPEIAWNDTALYGSFSQSGGGASSIFGKPSWQTGTGVPADGRRDVPDVSLPAGVEEYAYIICSADQGAVPCTNSTVGFATGGGGLVGGTSAAAPNLAAILAIIEQANGGGALGNINSSLYTLAAGSSGSSVFHDITSGNNTVACKGGTTGCSSTNAATNGTMGYTAGTGYDQVTGLGSVAAVALQTGLKSSTGTSTLLTPTIALSASSTSPAVSTGITFTAAVSGTGGTPAGTVTFSVDGTNVGSAVTLASGSASYTYSGFTAAGTHTVVAAYAGSSVYYSGSATLSITTAGSTTGSNGISLAASPSTLTITAGNSGTETLTVTSNNGYTGSVGFAASLTSSTGTFNGCYTLSPTTVSPAANSTATTTMTVYTSATACTTAGKIALKGTTISSTRDMSSDPSGFGGTGIVVLSAGLLGCFALRRRVRMGGLLAIAGFALMLGLSGCGSSTSGTTTTKTKGTYVIQVTGTSVATTSVAATSSFTLTVQ